MLESEPGWPGSDLFLLFSHAGLIFCIDIITKFYLDHDAFFLEPFEVECLF